jgi:hypothetical protein
MTAAATLEPQLQLLLILLKELSVTVAGASIDSATPRRFSGGFESDGAPSARRDLFREPGADPCHLSQVKQPAQTGIGIIDDDAVTDHHDSPGTRIGTRDAKQRFAEFSTGRIRRVLIWRGGAGTIAVENPLPVRISAAACDRTEQLTKS